MGLQSSCIDMQFKCCLLTRQPLASRPLTRDRTLFSAVGFSQRTLLLVVGGQDPAGSAVGGVGWCTVTPSEEQLHTGCFHRATQRAEIHSMCTCACIVCVHRVCMHVHVWMCPCKCGVCALCTYVCVHVCTRLFLFATWRVAGVWKVSGCWLPHVCSLRSMWACV